MSKTVLLSEIHPRGGDTFDPLQQAFEWYQLVALPEVAMRPITNDADFVETIELIERRAHERAMTLVIRDWTHIDYTGVPFVEHPPYRLTLAEVLGQRFSLIQTTSVRHPTDQRLSLSKTQAAGVTSRPSSPATGVSPRRRCVSTSSATRTSSRTRMAR